MPESLTNTRRRNLLLCLNRFSHSHIDSGGDAGPATAFAQRIGIHKSLLSKLKAEGSSARDISDSMARQIEVALELPRGWMDEQRDDAPTTSAEGSFLQLALDAYRSTDAASRRRLRKLLQSLAAGGPLP